MRVLGKVQDGGKEDRGLTPVYQLYITTIYPLFFFFYFDIKILHDLYVFFIHILKTRIFLECQIWFMKELISLKLILPNSKYVYKVWIESVLTLIICKPLRLLFVMSDLRRVGLLVLSLGDGLQSLAIWPTQYWHLGFLSN